MIGNFDGYLLISPEKTQQQHKPDGKGIKMCASRVQKERPGSSYGVLDVRGTNSGSDEIQHQDLISYDATNIVTRACG